MDYKQQLLNNIDKLHTTVLGTGRIIKNLRLKDKDAVEYCMEIILRPDCRIYRQGKNWYCECEMTRITVNAHSYTIITAHLMK